jgi:hypothetical protein
MDFLTVVSLIAGAASLTLMTALDYLPGDGKAAFGCRIPKTLRSFTSPKINFTRLE